MQQHQQPAFDVKMTLLKETTSNVSFSPSHSINCNVSTELGDWGFVMCVVELLENVRSSHAKLGSEKIIKGYKNCKRLLCDMKNLINILTVCLPPPPPPVLSMKRSFVYQAKQVEVYLYRKSFRLLILRALCFQTDTGSSGTV